MVLSDRSSISHWRKAAGLGAEIFRTTRQFEQSMITGWESAVDHFLNDGNLSAVKEDSARLV